MKRYAWTWIVLAVSLIVFNGTAIADYAEECMSEGCDGEEVSELYSSYREECLGEGCSAEEVIELAGNTEAVGPMLAEFKKRGFEVNENDFRKAMCTGLKADVKCVAILLMCQDTYNCPDGLFTTDWYVCGGCLFSGC